MIAFKILESNKFAVLPDISESLFKSYLAAFPQELALLKPGIREFVMHVLSKSDSVEDENETGFFEISFNTEIKQRDLLDLGVKLQIYKDLNERIEEFKNDFTMNYQQQIKFEKMVRRVAKIKNIDSLKYMQKLSAYLDVFLSDFYNLKEITDTRFTVELILKNITKSNLLLGDDVESEIYELLPY